MIDIVGRRYLYFLISLIMILPGLIGLSLWGINPGSDFSGGSLLEVSFENRDLPDSKEVLGLFQEFGFSDPQVQTAGDDTLIIRSKAMDEGTQKDLLEEMRARFDTAVALDRVESVGPAIGQDVARWAAWALGLAAVGMLLYITYTLRGVKQAYRYGVAAILAVLHDAVFVLGIESILGHFLGWKADAVFVTALLTVIAFSVHDSIVVFDRIRENARVYRSLPYETMVNHSLVQTLNRSLNTQLMVMLTLLSLALLGGSTIRHFVVILLLGVFSGGYSSIFHAVPILVIWENQEWKNWFRQKQPAS